MQEVMPSLTTVISIKNQVAGTSPGHNPELLSYFPTANFITVGQNRTQYD